jgi:hypothetical protein
MVVWIVFIVFSAERLIYALMRRLGMQQIYSRCRQIILERIVVAGFSQVRRRNPSGLRALHGFMRAT